MKTKSNSVVTCEVRADGVMVFAVVGAGSFEFDPSGCSDTTEREATIHGYRQKISDRAAIGRDPETGATALPEDKFNAMKECADRLAGGGEWNTVSTGTGSGGGVLFQAMKALYPNAWSDRKAFAAYITEKAKAETAKRTDGQKVSEHAVRAGLMGIRKVADEIERIRAAAGQGVEVDFSDLEA